MFSQNANAATTLQKYIRGQNARAQFSISSLPKQQLTDYVAFLLGNDPEIKGLVKFKTSEPMALIGTSVFRSLKLICELSMDSIHIPKLIIIDNSLPVYTFWKNFKRFVAGKTKDQFQNELSNFLLIALKMRRKNDATPNILDFFQQLFSRVSFKRVMTIIESAVILKQGWEDQDTFKKIKNILAYIGIENIYMFASNLVGYCQATSDEQSDKIISNIAMLNPKLCIHTDLVTTFENTNGEFNFKGRAKNVYLVTDHQPAAVKKLLLQDLLHKELLELMKIFFVKEGLDGSVLLKRIEEKQYSRALRIAANMPKGYMFVSGILKYKNVLEFDINETNENGKAAIHFAKNDEIYRLLLANGAKPNLPAKPSI